MGRSNRQRRRQQARRAEQSGKAQAERREQTAGRPPAKGRTAGRSGGSSNRGWLIAGALVVVAAAVILFSAARNNQSSNATPTPNNISLAPAVDGIKCQGGEMLAYHIHQHLTIYDHGKLLQVPSSIGIPGGELAATCLFWIHVHAAYPDIIHVESPTQKTYTLGNFLDIWNATKADANPTGDTYLKRIETAAAQGQLTVYVNDKLWTKGYRNVPLTSHESITLEIGKPIVPPKLYTAWNGL